MRFPLGELESCVRHVCAESEEEKRMIKMLEILAMATLPMLVCAAVWVGCPSENFWVGRRGFRPEAIVIHIMDGSFTAGEGVFLDANTKKSAHYGIS